jgi:hypothetical protein
MPIVSDFYTHLYAPGGVTIKDQPLYEALNHLADAMRLRWNKEDGWLQFRSASFYNDRPKEVPNRLLARWSAARREHGHLLLDDLIEIAGLSDAQLDARDMAEGAKELWGLEEWGLAGNRALRPHLRWMAGFSPAERQKLQGAPGLRFTELTLPQQQQYITLALGSSPDAADSLADLATGAVQIDYSLPGQFEWKAPEKHGGAPEPLSPVRAATPAAALAAARRLDPQADLTQIQPTETAITLLYYWGTAQSNGVYRLHTTGPGDTSINSGRSKNGP